MKRRKSSLAVGLPTIVNILVLLLFACVSMLSLGRARADAQTAKHSWEVSTGYFAADSTAQTLLGEIEQAASLPPDEAGVEMESILNEQGVAGRYDPKTQQVSFTLSAGEAGTLSVRLHLLAVGKYEITSWKLTPHEDAANG